MSKYQRIAPEKRAEILRRIKEDGAVASHVATEHGISPKTVYNWLTTHSQPGGISLVEYGRLRRENEQLKSIVGELTLNMKRTKKI